MRRRSTKQEQQAVEDPNDPLNNVSEDLIADLSEAFRLFDTDGSGGITMKELSVCIESLGQNPSESDLQSTFEELDEDKSGFVDFPEFARFMVRQMQLQEDPAVLKEAFKIFDADGSGSVTRQELVETMKDVMKGTGESIPEDDIDEIIKEADKDGNGEIGYNEFLILMSDK